MEITQDSGKLGFSIGGICVNCWHPSCPYTAPLRRVRSFKDLSTLSQENWGKRNVSRVFGGNAQK